MKKKNTNFFFVSDEYGILNKAVQAYPLSFTDVPSTDVFGAVKLTTQDILSVPIEDFNIPNYELNIPFEVHALVTLNIDGSSCLFSIESDGATKISLCFESADEDVVKIIFNVNSDVSVQFLYDFNDTHPWSNIILRVDKNEVILFDNCTLAEAQAIDKPIEAITLSKNSKLFLGKLNKDDLRLFEVSTELAIQLDLNILKLFYVKNTCTCSNNLCQ